MPYVIVWGSACAYGAAEPHEEIARREYGSGTEVCWPVCNDGGLGGMVPRYGGRHAMTVG